MRLTNQRYEEIKNEICDFLFDYDINTLPIDVFDLAVRMKIKIVKASELLKKYPEKLNQYMLYSYPHSYLYYDKNEQKFIVYLDDVGTKIQRQRFSLAHEIMHIILGHKEQNSQNEAEANFGATYLLAPTSFVLIKGAYKYLMDPHIVMDIFNVSYSESKIIIGYFENRMYCDSKIEKYEIETINRFGTSFRKRLNIIK